VPHLFCTITFMLPRVLVSELTPWSGVLLEKMIVAQLVK